MLARRRPRQVKWRGRRFSRRVSSLFVDDGGDGGELLRVALGVEAAQRVFSAGEVVASNRLYDIGSRGAELVDDHFVLLVGRKLGREVAEARSCEAAADVVADV